METNLPPSVAIDSKWGDPVFVTGHPHSGTTLLQLLLAAHPNFSSGPETHFFTYVLDPFDREEREKLGPDDLKEIWKRFRHKSRIEIPVSFRDELETLARSTPISCGFLLNAVMDHFSESFSGTAERWVEKTPRHANHLQELLEVFPDASIIYLIRDPRDVSSNTMHRNSFRDKRHSLLTAIKKAKKWRFRVSNALETVKGDSRCYVVRYEALVESPEPTLREVMEFVSEPYNPRVLNSFSEHYHDVTIPEEHAWKKPSATNEILDRRGIWKARISELEARAIELQCRELMEEFGYEPNTNKLTEVYSRFLMVWKMYSPLMFASRLLNLDKERFLSD